MLSVHTLNYVCLSDATAMHASSARNVQEFLSVLRETRLMIQQRAKGICFLAL